MDNQDRRNQLSAYARVLLLCIAVSLGGCGNITLLNPKGPIGAAELATIGVAFGLMLIVIVPVVVMALWFPRKYRASDPKGDYDPKWSHSRKIDWVVWIVPAVIVTVLSGLVWTKTHQLEPSKPIHSAVNPINIEAVSLDWKWLFIYPDRNIATVNKLELPANVPVSLEITSDTVVTAFFIPQLGSQIYAMAGKKSRLHLLADQPGVYTGQNQQFSGRGYADMNFKVVATSRKRFAAWVKGIKQSSHRLNLAEYGELERPGTDIPVTSFSWVVPDLFDHIIRKYHTYGVKGSPRRQADDGAMEAD